MVQGVRVEHLFRTLITLCMNMAPLRDTRPGSAGFFRQWRRNILSAEGPLEPLCALRRQKPHEFTVAMWSVFHVLFIGFPVATGYHFPITTGFSDLGAAFD